MGQPPAASSGPGYGTLLAGMGGAQGCDARGCCGDGRSKEVLILQTAPEWRDLNSVYLGEDVEHRSWFERWDEGGVADLELDQGWLDRLELRAADPDGSEPGGSEPGGAEPGGADLGGADLGAVRPQDSAFMPAGPSRHRSLRLIALPAVPVQNLVLDLDADFPSAEAVAAGMGPTMLSGNAGAWPLSSRRRSDVGVLYSVEDDAACEAPQSLGDGQKVEALYASALRLGEEDEDGAISERDANDLAVFLCRHGEAERARRLQRHLLRLREARLGLGHPACAASASNLACSLLVCANRARPLGRDPWSPGLAVLPLVGPYLYPTALHNLRTCCASCCRARVLFDRSAPQHRDRSCCTASHRVASHHLTSPHIALHGLRRRRTYFCCGASCDNAFVTRLSA